MRWMPRGTETQRQQSGHNSLSALKMAAFRQQSGTPVKQTGPIVLKIKLLKQARRRRSHTAEWA